MADWVVETVAPRAAPDWRARLLWWLGDVVREWLRDQATRWEDREELEIERDRVRLAHAAAERAQWERRIVPQ